MLDKIEIFRLAHAMASHAGTRQAVVAQNIANADTPGYVPRDVTPFQDLVKDTDGGFSGRATRVGHLHGTREIANPAIFDRETGAFNPNDNGVILGEEMLKAVEVKRQHDKAMAIYRSGMNILRASLGKQ